jgi:hypothetical protein
MLWTSSRSDFVRIEADMAADTNNNGYGNWTSCRGRTVLPTFPKKIFGAPVWSVHQLHGCLTILHDLTEHGLHISSLVALWPTRWISYMKTHPFLQKKLQTAIISLYNINWLVFITDI